MSPHPLALTDDELAVVQRFAQPLNPHVARVVLDKAFCRCPGTDLALRLEELTTSHDNGESRHVLLSSSNRW